MKSLFFISILIAHSFSGWGGVIAAELCPHMRQSANADAPTAHACCAISEDTTTEPHCASMPQAEQVAQAASSVAVQQPGAALTPSCSHCCAGSSELPRPPTVAPQQTLASRDYDAIAATSISKLFFGTMDFFAPKIVSTQNAPLVSLRRHLLLKVFLI